MSEVSGAEAEQAGQPLPESMEDGFAFHMLPQSQPKVALVLVLVKSPMRRTVRPPTARRWLTMSEVSGAEAEQAGQPLPFNTLAGFASHVLPQAQAKAVLVLAPR